MNFFARFVQSLKGLKSVVATHQEHGTDLPTLILMPNSTLPKQSSTHRKVFPTQRLIDSNFVYTNSVNTDISTTFQKASNARLRTHPNQDRTSNQAVVRQMPRKQV
jgi:hypothetical protein